jgi:hypothetical protein
MARDWQEWHRHYDDPASPLSQRLKEVRAQLTRALAAVPTRPARLLSLCSGDGRDTVPVLAAHAKDTLATLVELDPDLARGAAESGRAAALEGLEVLVGDAGSSVVFRHLLPVDVLLLCGILGNVPDEDVARTVAAVPSMLTPGGTVIWTRGSNIGEHDPTRVAGDPAEWVRQQFLDAGLVEVDFVSPADEAFRVGAHRLPAEGVPAEGVPGRLFSFVQFKL